MRGLGTYNVWSGGRLMRSVLIGLSLAAVAFAADKPAPTIGTLLDQEIRMVESEVVPLAEAMPADKYDFAPTQGEFKGVRTFSQQMSHIAATNYMVASAALGEKNPSEAGKNENGPASIQGKDAVVKYLKDSFAYAHKAAASLTAANAMDMIASPFGGGKMARMSIVSVVPWHTFDHYGQAVVYARMNGIIPPASRR
jgi:uncharacterized damage-inducible protein DinB